MAATISINVAQKFPDGTVVGAFALPSLTPGELTRNISGNPGGAPYHLRELAQGAVGGSVLSLTGLPAGTSYLLWAEVGGVQTTMVAATAPAAATSPLADVVAPVATGGVVADTANLVAALAATPPGGSLYLEGHYKTNETLTRANAIVIRTPGLSYAVGTGKSTPTSGPTEISQLQGTIIECTVGGIDNFDFTGAAASLKVYDCAFVFTAGLATTGHAINCTPPAEEAGHAPGVYGGSLENVVCGGHDGNHYALVRTNVCEFTTKDFRWFGGGGILDVADSPHYNTGNIVDVHPYGHLYNKGSAGGYIAESLTSYPESHGTLNLVVRLRPQCNIDGEAGVQGTQPLWKDTAGAGSPARCLVIAPDMEAPGHANPVVFGEGTEVVGANTLLGTANQQLENVASGFKALGKASAAGAKQSTATGWEALASNTSNSATAFGCLAGASNTTGPNICAFGFQALTTNKTGAESAAFGNGALKLSTGSHNTAGGINALNSLSTANWTTGFGNKAGQSLTTGAEATMFGGGAAYEPAGVAANASVVGKQFVALGFQTGVSSTGDFSRWGAVGYQAVVNGEYAHAFGYKASAGAKGAMALGTDAAGTGASTTVENFIALGTVNHTVGIAGQIQFAAGSTGAGSALLGANSPAVTVSAPKTWIKVRTSAGEQGFIPVWV